MATLWMAYKVGLTAGYRACFAHWWEHHDTRLRIAYRATLVGLVGAITLVTLAYGGMQI